MAPVNSQISITLNLQIQDVVHGTGITKYVWLAQKDGFSMQTMFVPQ